jgi:aryl-alcohol dehydrogenase-like predicted oxidoreductase
VEAATAGLRRAVAAGINYFDTAPMYGSGESERLLGLALQALTPAERAGLYLSTKVGWHPERPHRYDAETVRWSLAGSLARLGVARVDLVHIHYPASDAQMDAILGPGGAVAALEQLKAEGVVGAISLGSRPHRFIQRAIESGRFDAVMTVYDYTLLRATAEPLIALAAAHEVGVLNGSPYVGGLLAGGDPDVAAARRTPDLPGDLERARVLWRWAGAHAVDLGALAVQFSLRHPLLTSTLVGPRDATEVAGNLRHATTPVPAGLWDELSALLAELGPGVPGGEAGVLA